MSFNVILGTIPDAASEFHGHINRRVGQPALEIRYFSPDGNPAPWSSMAYQGRTCWRDATNEPHLRRWTDLDITVGETDGEGVDRAGGRDGCRMGAAGHSLWPRAGGRFAGRRRRGDQSPQDDVLYLFPRKDSH